MKYSTLLVIGLAPATLFGITSEARAESEKDATSQGFGARGNNRLSLEAGLSAGERPGILSPATSGAATAPDQVKEDYKRTNAWLTYEYNWYWDKTRFGSLVGAELLLGLGYFTAEKANPARASEPSSNWSSFHGKFEGAFDYALFHWEGKVAGRFVFGAGAGGEVGSYWHTEDGRAYPLILSRVQVFPGSASIELGYRFIPTTTGDNAVREHRFGAAIGFGAVQFGAGATLLKVHLPDQRWLTGTTFQGTVAMVF